MLEVRELTLVEIVLTVLESEETEVPRPCTLVFTVPSVELRELTVVLSEDTEELRELTLLVIVPRLDVMPLTSVWIVATEAVKAPIDALSFVMFVPRPARPVTSVVIVASALALATPPLTVKEPMLEPANPEVLLVTVAPTRYVPVVAAAATL